MELNKIYQGDCLKVMKTFPDNSIDTIITDPPYGLSFMGKKWDYDVPSIEIWKEALRVLKPGGTALIFAGSRTYHRMACAVEDAGFDIFDTIYWHYASGFPKSYNIAKGITKQFDKIKKEAYNEYINKNTICKKLNNVNTAEQTLKKNQIGTGTHTLKKDFVVVNAFLISNEIIKQNLNVIIAELNLQEVNHLLEVENIIVQKNVETKTKQKKLNVIGVEKSLEIQNQTKENIVQKNATIYQCEKIMDKIKEEEVLKIELGNLLLLKKTITSVNYAELIENLKLIILNQSKTFQSLDTKYQMELLTAITVIITKSTMECLISSTESILDKEKENWTGWGTALKPSTEPIICARKRVDKNYVLNALKWGVSGLNIDGGRIEPVDEKDLKEIRSERKTTSKGQFATQTKDDKLDRSNRQEVTGRFPANIILDEEAAKLLDEQSGESKSNPDYNRFVKNQKRRKKIGYGFGEKMATLKGHNDKGGASRFFYVVKASKSERNIGCEELEEKRSGSLECRNRESEKGQFDGKPQYSKNNHPTVKPLKLMEYLCKLTSTPTGGIVLDPFVGSGTTCMACKKVGRDYIGIEQDKEYVKISEARIEAIKVDNKLF